ncbi:hypothetical protein A9Q83_11080 [Alphaproteobacteria bacterium 46_93_T64]|nr:hypothetical protein A9Q83_11080 [Alphaproteobacteria bacterium 46_93_T64]
MILTINVQFLVFGICVILRKFSILYNMQQYNLCTVLALTVNGTGIEPHCRIYAGSNRRLVNLGL